MSGPYDDIIGLPHPDSERHPRMPMVSRAAQFSPFAALTGYGDAVRETARLTDEKPELTEEEKALLDVKLQRLAEELPRRPGVSLSCFRPDTKKAGGAFVSVTGRLKKIDDFEGVLILAGGERIPVENILDIQIH